VRVLSIDRLIRMVDDNGRVVFNHDGIWQQRADGTPLHFTDAIGRQFSPPLPASVFNCWRKAKLISRRGCDRPENGLVFVLTRAGRVAGRRKVRPQIT
jgi:hypothetical protein